MRFLRLLAAASVVTLGGCGSDASPNATPGDGDRRDQSTEWYLRSISDDDRTVNIVYTMSGVASGCERKGTPRTAEASDKVVVTAYKSVTLDRDRACTEELGYVEESVVLDRPLGDRALVGCRPGKTAPSEDAICRDLGRSRQQGIFQFSPQPGR